MIGPRRLLAGALGALALLVTAAAPAGAACTGRPHHYFVGLGGGDSLNDPAQADCLLTRQAKAGAGVLRQGLDWRYIERAPGVYDFSAYDGWMAAVARHHIRVLPVLSNPPAFQSPGPAGRIAPPKSYAAYGRYAAAVVGRYGPKGSFWKANPKLPKSAAIRSWQIWNEPNLPQYWGGKPNARQYTRLLKVAAQAIHQVEPKAEIVTAGLPESLIKHAVQATRYVPRLYKAGAKRWFSTLAVNPYAKSATGVLGKLKRFRRIMKAHHDRRAKLWVTEVGWGTGGPRNRFNIGKRKQAKQLARLLRGAHKARRRLKLRGVVYYGWKDRRTPAGSPDQWGLHTGLLTLKGRSKPAYRVFARIAPKLR